MAFTLAVPTFADCRGELGVFDEGLLPFSIRRVFFMLNVPRDRTRGGHKHAKTTMALVCLAGGCEVVVRNNGSTTRFNLDNPATCLVIPAGEWHELENFAEGTVALALSSYPYDPLDYFDE